MPLDIRYGDNKPSFEVFSRKFHASCIDDNHKITGIDVWGKNRLVFSPQYFRDLTGHATQVLFPERRPRTIVVEQALLQSSSSLTPANSDLFSIQKMAGPTRLELATSGVTGRRSNQLNYDPDTVQRTIWWAVQDLNL